MSSGKANGAAQSTPSAGATTLAADGATVGAALRRQWPALVLAAVGAGVLCGPAIVNLAEFWEASPDFSHGYLVPVISVALLWLDRRRLASLPARRSTAGAVLLTLSLLVFIGAHLVGIQTVQRLALWGSLLGGVWFVFGSTLMRAAPFPFFFLLLAIPPPFFILHPMRAALRSLVTDVSTEALHLVGMSPVPEGNVIAVSGHLLEVADACSGIRSLVVIVATALLLAHVTECGWWRGALLTATGVPVAIVLNVVRVVVMAIALVEFDLDLTQGLAHELTGAAVFVVSLVLLFLIARFYGWLLPKRAVTGEVTP